MRSVRLKNIEETEKAKRKMIEDQQKKKKDVEQFAGSNYVATDRCKSSFPLSPFIASSATFRRPILTLSIKLYQTLPPLAVYQGRKVQSDHEYRKAPNPHAPPGAEGSGSGRGRGQAYDRRNMATDDIVLERFKKRMRR
ncbi:hypothetical protein BC936DRAFT_148488 [Jimgerdemannia flammicorona]|uniref:Uncharacterized protein n=1 Tax=Jimgerdemannia flammicorona TaxID=994334 RepID=A0A433D2X1_9FUNG|nr:hypothetical protein BC936DRAFT_148488 [Jimgerdemannia flammicorona]